MTPSGEKSLFAQTGGGPNGLALGPDGAVYVCQNGGFQWSQRPLPDGAQPAPGGWNRFVLEVADLDATVAALRAAGVHFRSDVVSGPGGRQVLVEDPSGNPVELFAPRGA